MGEPQASTGGSSLLLCFMHMVQFPIAASGGHSQKNPYAPKSMEITTLITMSEAMSGLNRPADIIPKSIDISLETTLSIIWEKKLGLF